MFKKSGQLIDKQSITGFTLIEMLLLSVLVGIILISGMVYDAQRREEERITRTVRDMQQLLNAALAYRLKNSQWPQPGAWPADNLKPLKGTTVTGWFGPTWTSATPNSYLERDFGINPWGQPYGIGIAQGYSYTNAPVFYAWTSVPQKTKSGRAYAIAQDIAGALPMSFTTSTLPINSALPTTGGQLPPGILSKQPPSNCRANTDICYVVAAINLPGENIGAVAGPKNANAVGFAGIYHHGGCVPVPTCIRAGDVPQIFVAPTSVSGVYQGNVAPNNLYKINSFTAYAKTRAVVSGTTGPNMCDDTAFVANSCGNLPASTTQEYWRVCLQVITEAGTISGNSSWGQYVSLMAVTRCTPQAGEPSGSNFAVFNN